MSLSNSRKITIRLTCLRKLHNLLKETLHMICDELQINSLQQLSLANKSLRTIILSLSNDIELTRVNVRRLEIEKRTSKVLVINSTDIDYDVFRDTLEQCSIHKISSSWQISKMTEDTLAYMILDPVMNAFLDNTIEGIEYYGADSELPESRGRKLIQAAEQTNIEPQKQILNVRWNSFSPPHYAEYYH